MVLKKDVSVLTATHPARSRDQSRDSRMADVSRGVMFPCSRAAAMHQPKHTLHPGLLLLPSRLASSSVPADGQGLSRFLARKHWSYSRSHVLGW